ncbi:glutathione S-transferase family protein [Aureimonas mangrovi]|uniref:glutathione S-transferase family protein n=1 Tax=Aureimonas mangrovi TaxID=2758041 RepID=UPI00163DE0EF|nr:glutathione S-transferase [Aureimonas mangrovi]
MKLFDGGRAPNPRRVRIFMAEKGITLDIVPVDMGALGHRQPEIADRNPLRRLPVLELDDGRVITESVAICRYLEETLAPEPSLFGNDAFARARVEEWNRRLELNFYAAVAAAFRHIHPAMAEWEVPQLPEWGEANKPKALDFLRMLDAHLVDKPFVAGEAFSIADITGLVALDFTKLAKIAVPEELTNVRRWHADLAARESAKA